MGLKEKWGCFIIIMMMVFCFGANGCWGCLKQEKAALLRLKALFNGPEYDLSSWIEDENSDCCHGWEGVTCGPNRRVFSLSIPRGIWEGDICSEIHFNASLLLPFQELQQLYLSESGIVSWVEAKGSTKLSSSLTKLEVLDLSSNSLSASIIKHLNGFHSLKDLSLSDNSITGLIQLNNIEAISKNLKKLDLHLNDISGFTGENSNGVPNMTSSLHNLETLDLSYNYWLDNSILPYLSLLPSLNHLWLDGNQLSGVVQLNDFEAKQNLQELGLSGNNITCLIAYNGSMKLSTSLTKLERLDLRGNQHLSNKILSTLGGLPSLKRLYLDKTGLTGEIVVDEAMNNLQELSLSGNNITGFVNSNETMKLSTSLTKLELLDLSENQLVSNKILSTLGGLPSLTQLYLDGTGLTGQIEVDETMNNLQELYLRWNDITGFVNNKSCRQMQKLQKLYLGKNKLTMLPSCWANLSSLQKLDISYNQLKGNSALSPLIQLHSLEVLWLSGNKFQMPHSLEAFANHSQLKSFVANSNTVSLDESVQNVHTLAHSHGLQLEVLALTQCGLITYPPILHHQYKLRLIDLSHNSFKGEFPTWLLENNLQLEGLFMKNISLTSALQLPSSAHTHVRVIDFSQNKVQGYIPPIIGAMLPQLYTLDMSNNEFKGDIPSSLCDIKPLTNLFLSDNQLSGGLGNLAKACFKLVALTLSNNKFEGRLPSFYDLSFLKILDLQGNNFSKRIELNMFSPSLRVLNLSNNSLEGPITKDVCKLCALFELDLSHNKLNGSVPFCLLNSSTIRFAYLNNNKLSGHITHYFEYASSLLTLDLSYNNFTGEIPASIANFTDLCALLLRGNQFHNQIPVQLCRLEGIGLLDLSHNDFSGPIPPCLANIPHQASFRERCQFDHSYDTSHYVIDEGMTEMLGTANYRALTRYDVKAQVDFTTKGISYTYRGNILKFMSGLDLSCNKLVGEIPPEIGNLNDLHALNLSHNDLRGPIPATFSNLKSMESLDLSHNNLNGSIPIALVELDSLEVFNVAYNNLSGKVPFEAHSTTFSASSYEGNPFLCGPPLSGKNCTQDELPSADPNDFEDKDAKEDRWTSKEIFYVSFAVLSITTFLVVVMMLWINPHWGNVWFYLVKTYILSIYYFIEDGIKSLSRARTT